MTNADTIKKPEHAFEAEVAQLLKLMVHAVYSNKDIFLRELISNAADACEKLRYRAIEKPELLKHDPEFKILLKSDEKARTLSVIDNGIGMSRDEMMQNLGTIARSGTKAFLDGLSEKSDGQALIGQFGVGFYSAFMVAERVDVYSRKAGENPDGNNVTLWSSTGEGTYTIEEAPEVPADMPPRGTIVRLHLSKEGKSYAAPEKVEEIVRAYSAHVPVPVHLSGVRTVKGEDGKDRKEPFTDILGDGAALWAKPKASITEEEYSEFYHNVSGQYDTPARTIHYRAEGRHEYTALAFIPGSKPFDLFDPDRKGRMKLYVRRVFISGDIALLPAWLRFVRGLVDSEDLPLNISREILQDNPILEAIKTGLTKRILSDLKKMADKETETYLKVWEAFGAVIKEGLYEDVARRDEIYQIARFRTSRPADQADTSSGDQWRSLADYVKDMKENQTAIYYALGDSVEVIKASPHLEGYRARNIEVLYLADPVDAFWVRTALGFEGKPFKSITQGADDLESIKPADTKDADAPQDEPDITPLFAFFKKALGDDIALARASSRLAESPVCLVASDGGLDIQLQKILKDQPHARFNLAPILEVNPRHALIRKLAAHVALDKESALAEDIAVVLHGQARIAEGENPLDPPRYARALGHVMEKVLD